MKRMSFMLTTEQVKTRVKTVTRRLKCGLELFERFWAVERMQGLKKGQKQNVLALCEVVRIDEIKLSSISLWDNDGSLAVPSIKNTECAREGFPEMTGDQFVKMFTRHMKCDPETPVFRIEFKYVKP